jgi:hypothetical protein
MASQSATTQQPQNHLKSDCQNCRMHMVGNTGLAECLMEIIRGQWATPFGDTRYCEHPSAKHFVNFVNSNQSISGGCLYENSAACSNMDVAR